METFMVFVVLLHVSQHASGVEVYEGAESVLLPCRVSMILDNVVVTWSRHDLNPATVHQLHQEDPDQHYVQNQRYSSRTAMSADALESGDFNLTLNKPRLQDSGSYTCSIRTGTRELFRMDVDLQVKEPYSFPDEAWGLLVLLLVVLAAVLGFAIYLQKNIVTVSQVEVEEGAGSVVLPYKTLARLPEGSTVQWGRSDPEPMKVHVYPSNAPVKQDEFYNERTQMDTDPLRRGDLSLRLLNPCFRDRGTYICTAYNDGKTLQQKVVRLQVKGNCEKVEVEEWMRSVTLPFITTLDLPEDVTVEWRRSKPKPMTTHVYEGGKHQPDKEDIYYRGRTQMKSSPLQDKDLSVTIHNSGYSDRGTYVCTVSRDGHTLLQKVVLYSVRVCKGSAEPSTQQRRPADRQVRNQEAVDAEGSAGDCLLTADKE